MYTSLPLLCNLERVDKGGRQGTGQEEDEPRLCAVLQNPRSHLAICRDSTNVEAMEPLGEYQQTLLLYHPPAALLPSREEDGVHIQGPALARAQEEEEVLDPALARAQEEEEVLSPALSRMATSSAALQQR